MFKVKAFFIPKSKDYGTCISDRDTPKDMYNLRIMHQLYKNAKQKSQAKECQHCYNKNQFVISSQDKSPTHLTRNCKQPYRRSLTEVKIILKNKCMNVDKPESVVMKLLRKHMLHIPLSKYENQQLQKDICFEVKSSDYSIVSFMTTSAKQVYELYTKLTPKQKKTSLEQQNNKFLKKIACIICILPSKTFIINPNQNQNILQTVLLNFINEHIDSQIQSKQTPLLNYYQQVYKQYEAVPFKQNPPISRTSIRRKKKTAYRQKENVQPLKPIDEDIALTLQTMKNNEQITKQLITVLPCKNNQTLKSKPQQHRTMTSADLRAQLSKLTSQINKTLSQQLQQSQLPTQMGIFQEYSHNFPQII